jgi:hypothetical protein
VVDKYQYILIFIKIISFPEVKTTLKKAFRKYFDYITIVGGSKATEDIIKEKNECISSQS